MICRAVGTVVATVAAATPLFSRHRAAVTPATPAIPVLLATPQFWNLLRPWYGCVNFVLFILLTLIFLFHVEVNSESNEDILEEIISVEDISEDDIAIFLQLAYNINFWLQLFSVKLHFICTVKQKIWKFEKQNFAIILHLYRKVNFGLQFFCKWLRI